MMEEGGDCMKPLDHLADIMYVMQQKSLLKGNEMGYLLLAVMFYSIVKAGVDVWSQLRYEFEDKEKNNYFGDVTENLKKRIADLEKRVGIVEMAL